MIVPSRLAVYDVWLGRPDLALASGQALAARSTVLDNIDNNSLISRRIGSEVWRAGAERQGSWVKIARSAIYNITRPRTWLEKRRRHGKRRLVALLTWLTLQSQDVGQVAPRRQRSGGLCPCPEHNIGQVVYRLGLVRRFDSSSDVNRSVHSNSTSALTAMSF